MPEQSQPLSRAALGAQRIQKAQAQEAARQRRLTANEIQSGRRPLSLSSDSGRRRPIPRPLTKTPEQISLERTASILAAPLIDFATSQDKPLQRELVPAAQSPELRSLLTQRVLDAVAILATSEGDETVRILAAQRVTAWSELASGASPDELGIELS